MVASRLYLLLLCKGDQASGSFRLPSGTATECDHGQSAHQDKAHEEGQLRDPLAARAEADSGNQRTEVANYVDRKKGSDPQNVLIVHHSYSGL